MAPITHTKSDPSFAVACLGDRRQYPQLLMAAFAFDLHIITVYCGLQDLSSPWGLPLSDIGFGRASVMLCPCQLNLDDLVLLGRLNARVRRIGGTLFTPWGGFEEVRSGLREQLPAGHFMARRKRLIHNKLKSQLIVRPRWIHTEDARETRSKGDAAPIASDAPFARSVIPVMRHPRVD